LCTVNAIGCTTYHPPPQARPSTRRAGPDRQDTPWHSYLGTPQHDVSAAETLSADPQPRWHTMAGRAVRGCPAVGETVIAVGTVDRQVVLLERATGQVLWRTRLRGTIRGGPLLARDRLYVGTEASPDGRVYALHLKDGRVLWSVRTGSVAASLALDHDTLYAATEPGMVLRIATGDGKIVWRRQLAGAVQAAPVPVPGGLVVATTADTLFLLDRAGGEVRRRLATVGAVLAGPALGPEGTDLYFATTAGHVVAVTLPHFAVTWDVAAGDAIFGAPALARDTVYALARNGMLWLIPRATALGARSLPLDIVATAGPTPLARGVLAASVSGAVLLVDPATGTITWRAQLDGPIEQPPLVRDGDLVVVGGRGDIHTYR
jgi:outer membrane protein assembly factor BamB